MGLHLTPFCHVYGLLCCVIGGVPQQLRPRMSQCTHLPHLSLAQVLCNSGRVPFQSLSCHTGVKPWRPGSRSAFRHHSAMVRACSRPLQRPLPRGFGALIAISASGPLSLCIISQRFRLHSRKDLGRARVRIPSFHLLPSWFLFAPLIRRYDFLSPLSRLSTQHRLVRILLPPNTHFRYPPKRSPRSYIRYPLLRYPFQRTSRSTVTCMLLKRPQSASSSAPA